MLIYPVAVGSPVRRSPFSTVKICLVTDKPFILTTTFEGIEIYTGNLTLIAPEDRIPLSKLKTK